MGYSISHSPKGLLLRGKPNARILRTIQSNFHHLSNAIHTPIQDIHQQLGINISDADVQTAKRHKSGIYDDRFITFQLVQTVMENQQKALVHVCVCSFTN